MRTGIVFDIKRFAIHDGPGTRTTLFLKGCPLRCSWCHNPESIDPKPQLMFFEHTCIQCGRCYSVCPEGALELRENGERVYHRDRCTRCGSCVEACYAEALVMRGREMTVDEAVEELKRDLPFYRNSGGGITLSGGEPMHQAAFSTEVMRRCKEEGLHTALDTSGLARWELYEAILPHTDLVLYDFKHADPAMHRRYVGADNRLIHENLKRIAETGTDIEVRMPLVEGVNDCDDDAHAAGRILAQLPGIARVELLPYHQLGEAKYRQLGTEPPKVHLAAPPKERVHRIAAILQEYGLPVHVGS